MAKIILVVALLAISVGVSFGLLLRSPTFQQDQEAMLDFAESFVPEFMYEYQTYYETGNKSEKLGEMMDFLKIHPSVRKLEIDDVPEPYGLITCLGCKAGVNIILDYRRRGKDENFIIDVAIKLCKDLNIQPDEVCTGIIPINIDPILYVIDARPRLHGDDICSLILQGTCGDLPQDIEFKVDVDPNVEEITKSKSDAIPRNDNEFKILHFTDIHYQPQYQIGGNANCAEPLCCRGNAKPAEKEEDKAGYWGDYRDCDTPIHALKNALEEMKSHTEDIDLIYYTGDIIDHAVWATSQETNLQYLKEVFGLIKETFPGKTVIPIPGNHEAHPVNVFAPTSVMRPNIYIHWLYQYLREEWAEWLPEDALKTVEKGAYYTVLVKPGFRIIAMNNNDCYTYNWWVLYGQDSMKEQLQWFHDTLLEAERNNEKVHVVIHIPSGEGSCNKIWSREYTRVIERFHRIISAQFNGHTHRNEIHMFHDRKQAIYATSVAWNAGSITPFSNVNPNFMIYYVDNEIFQINEMESWIYNLTEANMHPERNPVWVKQYTFAEKFNLPDLSPATMNDFVFRMAREQNTLKEIWTHKVKAGDPFLNKGCDKECQKTTLCEIVTSEILDLRKCEELVHILNSIGH